MGILDDIKQTIESFFIGNNSWLKRIEKTELTLESCNGVAVANTETDSCSYCVALNNTIFKSNNMPNYYHLRCKGRFEVVQHLQLFLDFSIKKITHYLFSETNKTKMMKSMGYLYEDYQELYDLIQDEVKIQFKNSKYILGELNNYGQHFKINIYLNGKRDHINEKFLCYVGCIAYPFGKIKVATPLVKVNKE